MTHQHGKAGFVVPLDSVFVSGNDDQPKVTPEPPKVHVVELLVLTIAPAIVGFVVGYLVVRYLNRR